MKVASFDLPLEEIRRSLDGLRRPLRVAVQRARNGFNVGAIIRVAHSFLVREIVLIGTEPYYQRASMGMERFEHVVTVATDAEFVDRARAQGGQIVAFEKEAAKSNLWQTALPDDCTMVFGSEVEGVSETILGAADLVLAIPMYGINHSFPVTAAASIAMAEWTRQHYERG